ncbi:MAG: cytochrome c oxidase subunit 4 [Actinomycetota bacterium]|jgi:hypothetical protein|nr:cytochrome c oxidase subunit 4 [Actinomycetota bacterium]
MKAEIKLFGLLAPFFLLLTVVYAYFTGMAEWVGIVGLALTTAFSAFIAGYLALTARKLDLRPDDDPEGEIADAAGDYGFFSPHSWWPLWLGLSAAVLFLGVAVGWWLVMIAAPFAAVATIGWTFEYFRGEKAV